MCMIQLIQTLYNSPGTNHENRAKKTDLFHIGRVFSHVASIYANLLEQKKAFYIRKELNSQRTGLGHKHGRRFIVLGHKYGRHDVM